MIIHSIYKIKYLLFTIFLVIVTDAMSQLSISPGDWVTVKSGGSMMIGTDVHIKSVSGASGYLVDQNPNGDITITGDVTVERYMAPNVWHNSSSPVSNATSGVYTTTDLVFWYNEALILNDWNFGWVWYYGTTGGPLVQFRGYDVYIPDNPETIYYETAGSGSLNTGPFSINVINTSSTPTEVPSHKGWNLLGNPYPSPVDWLASSGWGKSAINDAKYIWDGTNDIYTIYIGGGSPIGINGGTRFIPSNQGFWVQATVASGSVTINNATRVGDISGTPDFYKEAVIDYPLVSLVASGGNFHDEVVVRFIPGTTEEFDLNMDAMKLYSANGDVPQLTIHSDKHVMALNTYPAITDNLGVNLSFRCASEGVYNIRLTDRTQLDAATNVYLVDQLENKTIHLNTDSVYTFIHDPENAKDRFKLYFNPDHDIINNITPDSWFTVYGGKDVIVFIKNTIKEISGNVYVYDLLGRTMLTSQLNNDKKSTINVNLTTGYYIVSIVTSQNIINSKVFVSH